MRAFFLNTALVSIAAAILKFAAPYQKHAKQLSFLIVCFFFVCIVGFAAGLESSVFSVMENLDTKNGYIDFSYEVNDSIKKETAQKLTVELRKELEANGIFPENIYVIVNISDNNRISINEIRLALNQADLKDSEKCVQIIREKVGEEIDIRIEIIEV